MFRKTGNFGCHAKSPTGCPGHSRLLCRRDAPCDAAESISAITALVSAPLPALTGAAIAATPSKTSDTYSNANGWDDGWLIVLAWRRAAINHHIIIDLAQPGWGLRAGTPGWIGIDALLGSQIDFPGR